MRSLPLTVCLETVLKGICIAQSALTENKIKNKKYIHFKFVLRDKKTKKPEAN